MPVPHPYQPPASRTARTTRGVPAACAVLAAALLTGCTADGGPADPAAAPTGPAATAAPREPSPAEETEETGGTEENRDPAFTGLEEAYQARLGVYARDTGTGRHVAYRADERFPFLSTIKTIAAAEVLEDSTRADLGTTILYGPGDLVEWSPETEEHAGEGMPLGDVLRAAITASDNTAANLVLDRLGGPHALEARLRGDGDDVTSVDRPEPELNEWSPGETRDTTTPRAIAAQFQEDVLGDELSEPMRGFLVRALRDNKTGDDLIRAGVPEGWDVGDKTGSAGGMRNDLAVLVPPGGDPIILAVYTHTNDPDAESDPALIAEATRVVVDALTRCADCT
ncbi:class A beta-lactamase [Myceligenerans xiligouense]|uniref:Beta-lactamase n=1 Tax=Myceligenerans xiligouense TaxID=253184 RepID=A0A3N4YMR1_9MICO|nr:class A beta-lactamase [Myceligenerans xiligouense]RPF21397.1 beta-lactamase class A [Myceligenerans xiligouense]